MITHAQFEYDKETGQLFRYIGSQRVILGRITLIPVVNENGEINQLENQKGFTTHPEAVLTAKMLYEISLLMVAL